MYVWSLRSTSSQASAPFEKGHAVPSATFIAARQVLMEIDEFNPATLACATGRGPRSMQLAFARHPGTALLRYHRALRLRRSAFGKRGPARSETSEQRT